MSYLDEKIAFVTGHHGGEPLEILMLMISLTVALGVLLLVHRRLDRGMSIVRFACEWLFLFAAPVLFVVSDYALVGGATFLLLFLGCTARQFMATSRGDQPASSELPVSTGVNRWAFISAYRCSLMISTCVAILAVDFTAFPRRFAKTETFGLSVMDLGVGSFVFARGLCLRPHSPSSTPRALTLRSLWLAVFRSWPVWLLGLARLATVKGTAYPEHVSEYGTHLNFFFTMAAVSVLAELLLPFFTPTTATTPSTSLLPCWLTACYLVGYQALLSNTSLTSFVFDHPREDLLSHNREGLVSIGGYFCLLIIGHLIGRALHGYPLDRWAAAKRAMGRLLLIGLTAWLAAWLISEHVQPPSRRLLNLSYSLYTVAFNTLVLLANLAIFSLLHRECNDEALIEGDSALPLLYRSVNRNQLVVFLVANLLTGAVNFSIRTLDYNFGSSLVILLIYSLVLACFCALTRNVPLKFW